MRVLLATEGESDEVVAQSLLNSQFGEVSIHPKSIPGRGVDIILREKAAGLADCLIAQMQENEDWPVTLRWFLNELTA